MLTVAASILTRNRLQLLQECVEAIRPQLMPGDEIVVIDTGSIDGTRDWLNTQLPPLRWKSLDLAATDFGAARNAAVREAGAQAIAFVDDDCLPQPGWLAEIRNKLEKLDAVGGLALFGRRYNFPGWWSPEVNWAVGMSGPALIRGTEDDYPSTSNLAARREQFLESPFQETPHGFNKANIYMGGREDAEWWGEARRRGARTGRSLRSVVLHRIPEDRIRWRYVWKRASTDGQATWMRRPCTESAAAALHESAHGLVSALGMLLRGAERKAVSKAAAELVWSARQKALVQAAQRNPVETSPHGDSLSARSQAAALAHAIRRRAASHWYGLVRRTRPSLRIPDEPGRLLVAAPTFLGDSLLLQTVVRMLAETWPQTSIDIWTRYPQFYTDFGQLVRPTDEEQLRAQLKKGSSRPGYDVVFAPYYEFGCPDLWRRELSSRGIAFNCEMGFPRDRDYRLAGRIVEKDFQSHEILNLLRLVSAWPLSGDLRKPVLKPCPAAAAALMERYPFLQNNAPYAALQVRRSAGMKDWPAERWAKLAAGFVRRTGVRVVLHESPADRGCGEEMIRLSGLSGNEIQSVTCELDGLIALLEGAVLGIGICSGPKHLAMALGIPTFTLYGPTDPIRWGALFDQEKHAYVRSPAGRLTGREHHCLAVNHAMLKITVEEAVESLVSHYHTVCEGFTNTV